ncbi:hypothetical protein F8M41_020922 [Gigaspora margarita]|uniref:Uncharacterized protein n=1 Tax=Gigaspora margarita TaxID=4874 RepID=A0A8H4EJ91_GIGMA|nr:hypothetical protein F8M41_020922 [Gigaspora margarita]
MSRKQSAKDILKTISQDSSHQSKSSTSTSNRLPTSTHRTLTTVDSWSDIERDDNEPLLGLNDEPLSSLDMDNLSFLPKKRQQTSTTKINILDTKEKGAALVDESSDNEIMLDYNDEDDDDDNDLLFEEELAEDIRYSNINEFEDF